jgi:trans-aconitate 2-methyltransferase
MSQGEVRRQVGDDPWDPAQYRMFAAERAQPFWDLVGLIEVPPGGFGRSVDLGCGSGELTAAVTQKLGIEEMVGIDSSDAMLTAARESVGCGDDRLRFARGDVGKWTGRGDHDLVIANASLHWVPDHQEVLARWWAALAPGGQLAVQVPANADHPAHRIASQVAATEPFLSAFNSLPPPDPVAVNVLAPEQYATVLDELGAVDQHVRLQVYPHHLESVGAVVEWIKGSSLTRFTKLLDPVLGPRFLEAVRTRVVDTLGEQAPYFYPFKRILMWARK